MARCAAFSSRPWTRMATVVPSSGRARSMLGKDDGIGGEQALDAVRDVPARQRRPRNVLDVLGHRELCTVTLADELRPPQRPADLIAVGFPVLQNLDSFDAAVGFERERVGDVVMPADDLI